MASISMVRELRQLRNLRLKLISDWAKTAVLAFTASQLCLFLVLPLGATVVWGWIIISMGWSDPNCLTLWMRRMNDSGRNNREPTPELFVEYWKLALLPTRIIFLVLRWAWPFIVEWEVWRERCVQEAREDRQKAIQDGFLSDDATCTPLFSRFVSS